MALDRFDTTVTVNVSRDMKKIYKYFSSDVFDLVFQRDGFCGVKCSLPSDYNDPYELFLGVDFEVSADVLAVYKEIVQELPQFPTTCFSNSPVVPPMWAHYASNHSGFVLEFDVAAIKEAFNDILLHDVDYKDAPDKKIADTLSLVAVTMKPRHAVWLTQTVLSEAYFSEQTAWHYEQECRLVDSGKHVEDIAGNRILFIPLDCVSSIIVGRNFPASRMEGSKELAKAKHLSWFKLAIGKAQPVPFLVSEDENTYQFNGQRIDLAEYTCDSCSEPVLEGKNQCPWCSITETDEFVAASSNPFRVLEHAGLLEDYLAQSGKLNSRKK
jgi:hypothetical protein